MSWERNISELPPVFRMTPLSQSYFPALCVANLERKYVIFGMFVEKSYNRIKRVRRHEADVVIKGNDEFALRSANSSVPPTAAALVGVEFDQSNVRAKLSYCGGHVFFRVVIHYYDFLALIVLSNTGFERLFQCTQALVI